MSILRLQSVKIGGSLARNARFPAPTCLVSSLVFLWPRHVYVGKLQNLSFSKVSKLVVMSFCVAGVALCNITTCLITCRKCHNWRKSRTKCSFSCDHVSRLEMSRVSGFPVASPCLWGKLPNLSFSKVSKQVVVAGVGLCDIPTCFIPCRKFFYVAGATMHTTLYTLHFTLHTLHSTLYTPHCTLYTPHSTTLYTLHTSHSSLHTLHSTLHTLQFTPHTLHFTLHTLNFTLHTLHFTLYTLHFALHTLQFTPYTLHSALYTLHTPHSSLHTLHSALLTLHSTLHTLHFPLHTFHSTLHTLHFPLHTADW